MSIFKIYYIVGVVLMLSGAIVGSQWCTGVGFGFSIATWGLDND